MISSKILT